MLLLGQWLIRPSIETVGGKAFYKMSSCLGEMGYTTGIAFPNLTDNGLHLYPIDICESSPNTLRGRMPGLYTPLESQIASFVSSDQSVLVDGKTMMAIKVGSNNAGGMCWIDITGEW